MKHYPITFAISAATAFLTACGSRPPAERVVTRGLEKAARSVEHGKPADPAPTNTRPIAMVDGRDISLETLRPALLEAGGADVLEEFVLDTLLEREADARSIRIADSDIEAEKELLLATFADAGAARTTDEAARLLRNIRESRGLGPTRFAALLRRNATLRALIAPSVSITESSLQQARELRFGERRRARLIVAPSAAAASRAIERLNAGEDFSALAAEISIDSSAERGGVLEPISAADPSYPAAVRSTLRGMSPGTISAPIAVDEGYAILRLDEVIAPSRPALDEASLRTLLERDVRTQQERLLMNQQARRLLEAASVTIMDRTLDEAWRARSRR